MYMSSRTRCFRAQLLHSQILLLVGMLLAACTPIQPAPAVVSPAGPVPPLAERVATLTHVEGDVFVENEIAGGRTPGLMAPSLARRRANPFEPVAAGSTLQTGANGQATIVHANGQVETVGGNKSIQMTGQGCDGRESAPPQSAASVAPGPSCQQWKEDCIIRGETRERERDYGNIPIILSPRNSNLAALPATVVWVGVTGAIEYELSLSHPPPLLPKVVVAAEELACTMHEWTAPHPVCSIPWPAEWPLTGDVTYFLQVGARTGIVTPLEQSEKGRLHILTGALLAAVEADVTAVRELALDATTEAVLLAGVYAANEAWNLAIPMYEQMLDDYEAPLLYIALGDAYRAVDLQRFAYRTYSKALRQLDQGPDDPLLRARARFGQGQVEYNRMSYIEAGKHFSAAVDLYRLVGDNPGLAAAEEGLAAVVSHTSTN
jgi:hypothetical protein